MTTCTAHMTISDIGWCTWSCVPYQILWSEWIYVKVLTSAYTTRTVSDIGRCTWSCVQYQILCSDGIYVLYSITYLLVLELVLVGLGSSSESCIVIWLHVSWHHTFTPLLVYDMWHDTYIPFYHRTGSHYHHRYVPFLLWSSVCPWSSWSDHIYT